MPISGINNTYNPFRMTERNLQISTPTTNKDSNQDPLVDLKLNTERNTAVNNINTDNRNFTNITNKQTVKTEPEQTPKDQGQVTNQINMLMKSPNGMDSVAQAMAQGFKGINRLA